MKTDDHLKPTLHGCFCTPLNQRGKPGIQDKCMFTSSSNVFGCCQFGWLSLEQTEVSGLGAYYTNKHLTTMCLERIRKVDILKNTSEAHGRWWFWWQTIVSGTSGERIRLTHIQIPGTWSFWWILPGRSKIYLECGNLGGYFWDRQKYPENNNPGAYKPPEQTKLSGKWSFWWILAGQAKLPGTW